MYKSIIILLHVQCLFTLKQYKIRQGCQMLLQPKTKQNKKAYKTNQPEKKPTKPPQSAKPSVSTLFYIDCRE